jgi:4-amino-4-deoxy-L-arabinose transferase-like glycosyltransferase
MGWAFDEILPVDVVQVTRHLLDGWATRYPPLHYYLLWSIWRPFLKCLDIAGVVASAADLRYWLFLLGRSLSVLMATATVYLVYRTARSAFDRPTSTLAALTCAVMAPFVYYAKTMNLEAPYLFWFALSLWFLVKVLRRHRLRDTLALSAATAFSICSKDQAFALYLAVPPLLVWSRWRHQRARDLPVPLWRSVIHPHLLAGGLLSVALFALIHRVPFDPVALQRHIGFLRNTAPFTEFSNTFSGHVLMLIQSCGTRLSC